MESVSASNSSVSSSPCMAATAPGQRNIVTKSPVDMDRFRSARDRSSEKQVVMSTSQYLARARTCCSPAPSSQPRRIFIPQFDSPQTNYAAPTLDGKGYQHFPIWSEGLSFTAYFNNRKKIHPSPGATASLTIRKPGSRQPEFSRATIPIHGTTRCLQFYYDNTL